MAENDYKINIALGTSFDPAGLEQAQQQLAEATQSATEATEQQATATTQVDEQLAKEASTLWELAEAKYGSAAADAKEQKAMQLATKSRNELIKTLKRLQGELHAAVEAQVRERAFFMARVENARILQEFKDAAQEIAAGKMTTNEARKRLRGALRAAGV